MRAWLTPDELPAGKTCIRLEVPTGEDWEAVVRGALVPLFVPENFEKFGNLTPEETAEVFIEYSAQWMQWERCVNVGTVFYSAGGSLPDNALWCNGSQVLQASYPELYAEIGDTWGSADSGYFRLPDLRGRVALGSTSVNPGNYELADTGGEEEHTLTVDEIPSHKHSFDYSVDVAQEGVGIPYYTLTGVLSKDTTSTGGGEAHNNMPPYAVLNAYIIAR